VILGITPPGFPRIRLVVLHNFFVFFGVGIKHFPGVGEIVNAFQADPCRLWAGHFRLLNLPWCFLLICFLVAVHTIFFLTTKDTKKHKVFSTDETDMADELKKSVTSVQSVDDSFCGFLCEICVI